jgi:hypothetical protein
VLKENQLSLSADDKYNHGGNMVKSLQVITPSVQETKGSQALGSRSVQFNTTVFSGPGAGR